MAQTTIEILTPDFLRKDGAHYTLSMGPCGGNVFSKPDAAALREMRQCVSRQSCVPSLER